MIRFPHAFLIFTMVFVVSCQRTRFADTRQPFPLTPVAQEIQRRGYRARESFNLPPTAWEVKTLRMRSKRLFAFKAEQPQLGSQDLFCRFALFEETYDSVADAQHR